MDSEKGGGMVNPVWVVLLPFMTGIFEELNSLERTIESYGFNSIEKIKDEIVARKIIRKHYSIERLFLMGIDDTGTINKNEMYKLPELCIGNFVEAEVKKEEESKKNGDE
ncbi:hypothetical protein [Lacrimispora sp.]|uniref:hypothetical protein n=1 Tax=Lacrimispora sp. TaxID=2719234 RepID=UPI0029E3AD03|nr:hypothetical protein [Lacrimispora sp.]